MDDDIERVRVIVIKQILFVAKKYHKNWKEYLHRHKQPPNPSSADIFRHGIVFHLWTDRDKLSACEELLHLEGFTPCLNSVTHQSVPN